ncbi:MAG: HEPN domain-containing protein [FCB group bacterium]|jgi:uncharacterized protein (UPF0332 family)
MIKDKKTYVQYLLQKSQDTLNNVNILLEKRLYNFAINRLYYSAFYSVQALLSCIDLLPKTHKGLLIAFNKNFIVTEILPKGFYDLYAGLLNDRQETDYGDLVQFKETDVIPFLEQTDKFIKYIEEYILKNYL